MPPMSTRHSPVCETPRLTIRRFDLADAAFILRQLNEDSFKRNIADKQVRSIDDAEDYLREVPLASYAEYGFGLYHVLLRQGAIPMGMCGLVKRDELEYPDLGYAFLPEFWGRGYAIEAGRAVLADATGTHGLDTIQGIALPDNRASIQCLTRLGFTFDATVEIRGNTNNLYVYRESL